MLGGMMTKKLQYRWRGDRLEAIRKSMGMTRTELAGAIGVTAEAVKQWEEGATPKWFKGLALIKVLGVDQGELIQLVTD